MDKISVQLSKIQKVLDMRLRKIHEQIGLVVDRLHKIIPGPSPR